MVRDVHATLLEALRERDTQIVREATQSLREPCVSLSLHVTIVRRQKENIFQQSISNYSYEPVPILACIFLKKYD